jgi:cytochrome c-type biogenesis protein CcmH/NrfG
MADEGTTGDPLPPFDESFVLGGPHEPSHRERLREVERKAAAERVARLRAEQQAAARRRKAAADRPRVRPGGPRGQGGSRVVAIVLIAVAVAGLVLSRFHFSSSHPRPAPAVTVPATSVATSVVPSTVGTP